MRTMIHQRSHFFINKGKDEFYFRCNRSEIFSPVAKTILEVSGETRAHLLLQVCLHTKHI